MIRKFSEQFKNTQPLETSPAKRHSYNRARLDTSLAYIIMPVPKGVELSPQEKQLLSHLNDEFPERGLPKNCLSKLTIVGMAVPRIAAGLAAKGVLRAQKTK